jgi:hypothetical protein
MNRALLWCVTSAIVGCSSSSSSPGVTCGAGTTEVNGQCVAAQDAGTTDSAGANDSSDASTAHDSAGGDGPAPTDAARDASGIDAGEPPSDQCPDPNSSTMPVCLDCDKTCCATDPGCSSAANDAGVDPACAMATCGSGSISAEMFAQACVVRTPNAPGTDPSCASLCPADGYVYGLGFSTSQSSNWLMVTVGSPWEVVAGSQTPYCTDSTSKVTTNCASFATAVTSAFYVMTKDPNAPARNITVTPSLTQTPCPPDGGI